MKMNFVKSAVLLLSSFTVCQANAGLINLGQGMIYDDVLDVTWLQDSNYAATTNNNDGLMTWSDSIDWVADLEFGGYDDWRLPSISALNGNTFNVGWNISGLSDRGYNIESTMHELAYMFYVNLGGIGYFDPSQPNLLSVGHSSDGYLNTVSFVDAESGADESVDIDSPFFWYGQEYGDDAWVSSLTVGSDSFAGKDQLFSAWAVRDGKAEIAAPFIPQFAPIALPGLPPAPNTSVSEPATLSVFAIALACLIRSRKTKV